MEIVSSALTGGLVAGLGATDRWAAALDFATHE
jgi:hypothetical protein